MKRDRQTKLLVDAYMQQWQELAKRMRSHLMPTHEAAKAMRESVQKAMGPIIENQALLAAC